MTENANKHCDELINNVCIQYIDDKQIVAIITDGNERDHIDSFMGFIRDYFYAQPDGKPLFLCFDISKSGYSVYGVRRFIELHQILGENMRGAIGVVIRKDSIGQTMKLFADINLTRPAHARQFFHDRESAIAWLRAKHQEA